MALPLADVRIIAVEQFGAGPWATLHLADLGAEVIKIEDPAFGGDVARYVPPYQDGEDSIFFETFNRNKKSVSLDLRHPHGRPVFEDLVRAADGVCSNLRGDQPARLGLRYEDLKEVNPKIVCCSLSGFGMTGPRAGEGGYDYMMQGLAGWQSLTGEPDGPPTKSGLSLADNTGGYAATIALLAGLWRARREGIGCDCDISLFETALQALWYNGSFAATHGYVPPRRKNSAHASIVPFQNIEAADGWLVVAAAKQKFWERLCEVMERPDLNEDPRFSTMAARNENRDTLLPILEEIFRAKTVQEWLDLLIPAGIPASKVNDVMEALEDPQTIARGCVVEHEHPSLGTVRTIGTSIRLSGEQRAVARAPFRGEHTEEVLTELCGYTSARIAELAVAGVFGEPEPESAAARG